MRRFVAALAVGVPLLLFAARDACAAPTLDFALDGGAGSVSFDGTKLIATGLPVFKVKGVDTPLHDGVNSFIDGAPGTLAFTSGALTSSSSSLITFGPGPLGGLEIDGGISSLGIAPGSVLLKGTVEGAQVSTQGGTTRAVFSTFVNGVNDVIADFYGLPRSVSPGTGTSLYSGELLFAITLNTPLNSPWTVRGGNVRSGDLDTSAVPEPSTLVLLGMGLAGVALYSQRRAKAGRVAD